MIFNNKEYEIDRIDTDNENIEIYSKDNEVSLYLIGNPNEYNKIKELPFNERTNVNELFCWDSEVDYNNMSYVFDMSKDDVYITRLNDNKYLLEINIEKPDMIVAYENNKAVEEKSFDNFRVSTEIIIK